jgi:hypothetical protein
LAFPGGTFACPGGTFVGGEATVVVGGGGEVTVVVGGGGGGGEVTVVVGGGGAGGGLDDVFVGGAAGAAPACAWAAPGVDCTPADKTGAACRSGELAGPWAAWRRASGIAGA